MTGTIALSGDIFAGRGEQRPRRAAAGSRARSSAAGSPPTLDRDRAFRWVGNNVGLDLCNTTWVEESGVVELLSSPRQLEAWLMYAGLHDCAAGLRRLDRHQARSTTAWVRSFRNRLKDVVAADDSNGASLVEGLNVVLSEATGHLCVRVADERLRPSYTAADPSHLVRLCVAAKALEVLAVDPARIRKCCGSRCGFLFVDLSRSMRRRWCDVDRCVDRRAERR